MVGISLSGPFGQVKNDIGVPVLISMRRLSLFSRMLVSLVRQVMCLIGGRFVLCLSWAGKILVSSPVCECVVIPVVVISVGLCSVWLLSSRVVPLSLCSVLVMVLTCVVLIGPGVGGVGGG